MFSATRSSVFIALLPAVFVGLTLASILGYHFMLQHSLQQLRSLGVSNSTTEILSRTDYSDIPDALALSGCYLGIFFFSELAFALMAMREYLQDLLHLDEQALMKTDRERLHPDLA
jgi:hypothetical protein